MSNNCNTCGGYVSAGGECRKCATSTNPPAKHPPRLWRVTPGDYGEQDEQPMTWIREPTKEEMLIGYLGTPYLSLQEHTALLQEERARGRAEALEEALKAMEFTARARPPQSDNLERILKGKLLAAHLGGEHYFGCLTGDCPHEKQSECNAAVDAELKEIEAARSPGDAEKGEGKT